MHNPIFKDVRLAFNSGEGHLKKHQINIINAERGGSPDRGGIYRQETRNKKQGSGSGVWYRILFIDSG